MKAELTDISTCKKSLDIEIPPEVVDNEITGIAKEFARRARVPGFRPGKAPLAVVKNRYRDEIASEMLQHLLPHYFSQVAGERKLDIVDTPNFENVDYSSGRPLKFRAIFEVYPELKIANYSRIPAEAIPVNVEDSEIDNTLKQLQQDNAELVPVDEDRSIRESDFVEISFEGVIKEGEEPQPIKPEKAVVEVGSESTLKEFNENLLGARVNDEKTFTITYLPEYPVKHLAGKTVEYTIKPESIKEKKIPELNDEFAQGLGPFQSIDELRAQIRNDMEKHKREHANEQLRDKLLEWLENNNDFEVPETLVQRQIQVRLQRLIRELARQGINAQRLDVDWAKLRDDQHRQSVKDVKGSLILDYIADVEQLSVNDDEIQQEIERIAGETGRPQEKVREILSRDSGLERLHSQIRNKKTLDFLQEHAEIQPAPAPSQS